MRNKQVVLAVCILAMGGVLFTGEPHRFGLPYIGDRHWDPLWSVAQEAGTDRIALYWTGDTAEVPAFDVPAGVDIRVQEGADLGERLTSAFASMLAGPGDRAVAIGADCPDLDPATVREAFAALDRHDVALGPASDGGYYLIGLRRPAPGLFRGVSWGTDSVLAETLQGAAREGCPVVSCASFPRSAG